MSVTCGTLGVSRSNLIEQSRRPAKSRSRYAKAADAKLLRLIRAIVEERASYG